MTNPQHSSESVEWYTPGVIVEAARSVMGAIDLDPASCATANATVNADRFFDREADGLAQSWAGRVWLNPPYGKCAARKRSNQAIWSARLIGCFERGEVEQAVLLVNASTGSKWFGPLWRYSICFPAARIHFRGGNSPTHSNALIYFGPDPARFADVFREIGPVVQAGAAVTMRGLF